LLVGPVAIHDGKALHAGQFRARLGNVNDPRVEIRVFAGQALVDRVGNLVRNPAPVVRGRRQAAARLAIDPHDLAGINVPEAERDSDLPVRKLLIRTDDQSVRLDNLPVGKPRLHIQRQVLLDEGGRVLHVEQAGRGEVSTHDVADLLGHGGIGTGNLKIRYRQRRRGEIAIGDPHLQLGRRRQGNTRGQQERCRQRHQDTFHSIVSLKL